MMLYLLIKRRKDKEKEGERGCSMVCEQIKSLAEFQSFPISFQSLTTDLEMLISHLLIADSGSELFSFTSSGCISKIDSRLESESICLVSLWRFVVI